MKINHFIGGVLLVSGTTVGAGMLALPMMTSFVGFFPSLLIFGVCWLVMLTTSYFFLDVNFAIEGEVNLISMAHFTLGLWGKVLSWIVYLLLLYALVAAYVAAGAPLFQKGVSVLIGHEVPLWASYFAFPLIFGSFVYFGTLGVDMINRALLFGLFISYLLLVGFLPEQIQGELLLHVDWQATFVAVPVVITSFGYHIIIPSLTTYVSHNKRALRWILFIGSVIPLLIYMIWQIMILGIVPLEGTPGLIEAWKRGALVTEPLAQIVQNHWIKTGAYFFSFFAIVTSFLGVSLSLSDFLIDGFKIKKTWEGRLIAVLLTFAPPLIFVLTYQRGFIIALEYAAAFVAILLIFLPAIMAWHLEKPKFYRTVSGRLLLIVVMLFAFFIVVIGVLEQWDYFKSITARYVNS